MSDLRKLFKPDKHPSSLASILFWGDYSAIELRLLRMYVDFDREISSGETIDVSGIRPCGDPIAVDPEKMVKIELPPLTPAPAFTIYRWTGASMCTCKTRMLLRSGCQCGGV